MSNQAWREVQAGVFQSADPLVQVSRRALTHLRAAALANPRRRARLCAHTAPDDPVHEMLIALVQGTYLQPHAHDHKSESFHVIAGRARLVLFDNQGAINQVIPLGPANSTATFFFRLAEPVFHTVLVDTRLFVIHETTTGPFRPRATRYAPWAPPEENPALWRPYWRALRRRVNAR